MKMTGNMVDQKNVINSHLKNLQAKKQDVQAILTSIEEVKEEIDQVKENEAAFLKQ